MTNYQHLAAIETEADILSCMMNKPGETIPKVRAELTADDFYRQSHSLLYTCLLDMYSEHKPIDISTIVPYLQERGELDKVGGITGVSVINIKSLGIGALQSYVSIIKDRARRRNAIQLMDAAIAQAADLSADLDLHSFQSSMAKVMANRSIDERSMKDIAFDFMTELGKRANKDMTNLSVVSGLSKLDTILHGFRRQELIYLAARPSMGKSALAVQIALHAAKEQGKQVLYNSLEMGERQIFGRAVANLTGINSETIMYSADLVNSEKYGAVLGAADKLSRIGLHIATKDVSTPQAIYNKALQVQGKYGLDMVIIDHVHLMNCGGKESDSQNLNMSRISKALKAMAIELDIPVLALAQLSRGVESRNDKHPLLSDLRDSGSLEQDADKVIMLYRQSYYEPVDGPDIVEILVRKHRDGRLGKVDVVFEKECSRMVATESVGSYESPRRTAPSQLRDLRDVPL